MWLQVLKGNVDDPGSGGEQALEKLFQQHIGVQQGSQVEGKAVLFSSSGVPPRAMLQELDHCVVSEVVRWDIEYSVWKNLKIRQ